MVRIMRVRVAEGEGDGQGQGLRQVQLQHRASCLPNDNDAPRRYVVLFSEHLRILDTTPVSPI